MKPSLILVPSFLLPIFLVASLSRADEWHVIKSPDGQVQAMLPGKAEETIAKTTTPGGVVTTRNLMFRSEGVEFNVSSTPLTRLILRFAGLERIFKNAQGGVLSKSFGKLTGYEETSVDGVPARLVRYDVVDFEDESHSGYRGLALLFVNKGTLYIANCIVTKDSGEADLLKFRDSIKINQ